MYDNPEMPRREPEGEVRTVEQLAALNHDDTLAGYMAGLDSGDLPIGATRSYLHGWLNAQVDRGRMQASPGQAALAREVVQSGYLRLHH